MKELCAAIERVSATFAVLTALVLMGLGFFGPPQAPPEVMFGLAGVMVLGWAVSLLSHLAGSRLTSGN